MSLTLPHSYQESKTQAERVYSVLLDEISHARTIYVGGTKAEGEAEFLCKLYPSLIFVDDYKAGVTLFGHDVISTAEMAKNANSQDFLINNCLTPAGFNHFSRQAESLGIPNCAVVEALAPHYKNGAVMNFWGLNSVYGPAFHVHTFKNLQEYANLRKLFTDKLSLHTFDNLINYRLTGNPNLLHSIAVGHNFGTLRHDSYILNSQFFTLSNNEVFVDAGALDGASSAFFIESVNGEFDRVIMFEPSSENAEKCRTFVKNIEEKYPQVKNKIDVIESGLYDHQGNLSFTLSLFDQSITQSHGIKPESAHIIETGLSSAFVEKGNEYNVVQVPVIRLDDYIKENPVTFIKFEIEGSEVAALQGSTKTILKNKPKLALSIYHRPQDLELIINYIKDRTYANAMETDGLRSSRRK